MCVICKPVSAITIVPTTFILQRLWQIPVIQSGPRCYSILLANIYVQDDDFKTIPAGLLAFSTKYVTDYQLLFAALTVVTIPMIAVYVAFNKQVVAGLTEGSLK